MLRERYLHPNGQIPAYEWNFGDVNPPVHAWATIFTYRLEKAQRGEGDVDWLERVVPQAAAQLHLVGQPQGPRRAATCSRAASSASTTSACSTAARRCRPAATSSRPTAPPGWRSSARTCSRSRSSWPLHDPAYEDMAVKFFEHFLWIASSMMHAGDDAGMWDEEDGFFYDVLRLPDGSAAAAEGALDGRPAAAVRGHRRSTASCSSEYPAAARRGCARFLEARPELTRVHPRPDRARRATAAGCASIAQRGQAAPRAGADARRGRVPQPVRHPLAVALPRRAPVRVPRRRAGVPRRATCRPSPTAACSAATRTGAGRSGCRSTCLIIRALLQYYTLLRRRLHGRVPDRLRAADDAVSRSPRSSAAGWRASSCATTTGRRPVYGGTREVPGRSALARPHPRSTSTSTATTAPASAPATRPAGPASSPASCTCSRRRTPEQVLELGKRPPRDWRPSGGDAGDGRQRRLTAEIGRAGLSRRSTRSTPGSG